MANSDKKEVDLKTCDSETFWESYSKPSMHYDMITDRHSILAFKRALTKELCEDKVILEVGCGTGLLSMFAAKAGAKRVYSVEYSDMCDRAQEVVKINKLDNIITVIKGRIEEVEIPEKVDIIMSNWMGMNLMYESLIKSVIVAREKYLKPDGIMLPDTCSMYLCGFVDNSFIDKKVRFWSDVYGFDFSSVVGQITQEPIVDVCSDDYVCSTVAKLGTFDMSEMKVEDITFEKSFEFEMTRSCSLNGVCTWFDCTFLNSSYITTKPNTYTRWRQTCFYFDDPLTNTNKGEKIHGTYHSCPAQKHPKRLDITIDCSCDEEKWKINQEYHMN